MAKLYPPYISGTLPSFYISNEKGTATMAVPFSMNKTVGQRQVAGFRARIKTTTTDILYGEMNSSNWDPREANLVVNFNVPDSILKKLIIGNFYKVQLAYVDQDGLVGYYSTVGIIKYTAQPRIEISGCSNSSTTVHTTEYIGLYHSPQDPGEKVYQYKFTLYNNKNEELESSGWLLHNSYEDVELDESTDSYVVKRALEENAIYKISYSVITNNNLQLKTPNYLIIDSNTIAPEIKASLSATLDYENGCINLGLIGDKGPNNEEYAASGSFLLSRSSSVDNFSTWLSISQFRLLGQLPSQFLFRDHTIEAGVTYRYSLQQFNDEGIYSNRILASDVKAEFEDIFLFDGERQLKIRFNPKVTSFKTVLLETKKNTIGNKYPFIFRNGAVAYKEFPIAGLISYLEDNDELFFKKEDVGYYNWKNTTDMTDDNITLERYFKLEVLDWLNNGKVKLFRSPQEGNYLVRLMNVSMSPIDSLGRMLHNFTCTASEVAEFTTENLAEYNLLTLSDLIEKQMRWTTLVLADMYHTGQKLLTDLETRLKTGAITSQEYEYEKADIINFYSLYDRDLLNGQEAYHLKFTDFSQGTTFTFVNSAEESQSIMIGATGQYEVILDSPITNLRLAKTDNRMIPDEENSLRYYQSGSITYSVLSTSSNRFDTVSDIKVRDITLQQTFGPSENILDEFTDLKTSVSRIHFARFTKLDVQPIYDARFGENGRTMMSIPLSINNMYAITYLDNSNNLQNNYYRYVYPGQLIAMKHYETIDQKVQLLSEHCYYTEQNSDGTISYYHLRGEKLIPYTGNVADLNTTKYNNLNPYIIYDKQIKQNDGSIKHTYYTYADGMVTEVKNYSTEVIYGDVSIDVGDSIEFDFKDLGSVPSVIKIGSGVVAELSMQLKTLTYSVEDNCKAERDAYNKACREYAMYILGYKTLSDKSTMVNNGLYFYWTGDTFEKIKDYEIENYKKSSETVYVVQNRAEVWSPLLLKQKKFARDLAKTMFMTILQRELKKKEEELLT